MSPILTRPVREQFEHDRIIRLLQVRYRRKFDVAMNPGPEQNASVLSGELAMYPDLLLYSQDRARKLQGTVEVETGESVNTLEAMAEWGPFSRLRVPFVLYVPPNSIDTAKRLCTEHHVVASEIWTYHTAIDQVRFTLVHRGPEVQEPRAKPAPRPARAEAPAAEMAEKKVEKKAEKKVAAKPVAKPAAKAAKKAAPKKPATAAKPAKPATATKSAAKKSAPKRTQAGSKASKAAKKRR